MTARTSRQEIRQAIRASGKTQEDTAAAIGVSPITLSRWLNGHADPGFDKLDLLATAIGQPIVLIFGRQQKTPPPEWAGAMERRIVSEVRANREALYGRLADDAAVKALRLAGLLPDEPTDRRPDQPPGGAGPSRGPIT